MPEVAIIGVGMAPVTSNTGKRLTDLFTDAALQAINDAGVDRLSAPAVIGGADLFRLFTEGDDLYEAMISAIAAAQSSVRLETFIFSADEIG